MSIRLPYQISAPRNTPHLGNSQPLIARSFI